MSKSAPSMIKRIRPAYGNRSENTIFRMLDRYSAKSIMVSKAKDNSRDSGTALKNGRMSSNNTNGINDNTKVRIGAITTVNSIPIGAICPLNSQLQ